MTLATVIPATRGKTGRNGVLPLSSCACSATSRSAPPAASIFMLFVLCGVFADVLAPYGFNQIARSTA